MDAAPQTESLGERVADSSSVSEGGRLQLRLEGRYVTVLRLDGKLHCIDSICFHAGGPLGIGDIEDVNGRSCIVCPWHYYKIDVETGDKYYQAVKFVNGKMVPGDWQSSGIKQRTHPVTEKDGGIYVKLNDGGKVESDEYACMASCGERVIHATPRSHGKIHSQQQNVGGDGRLPSGMVVKQARDAALASLPGTRLGGVGEDSGSG